MFGRWVLQSRRYMLARTSTTPPNKASHLSAYCVYIYILPIPPYIPNLPSIPQHIPGILLLDAPYTSRILFALACGQKAVGTQETRKWTASLWVVSRPAPSELVRQICLYLSLIYPRNLMPHGNPAAEATLPGPRHPCALTRGVPSSLALGATLIYWA